ncbi:LOW QUALITY PROTEIN: BICD family-like cargo adapter 1 [Paramacrobiotus metropolitanus]|uniref:LOW QUALITY PROTEIN: BICD family-like cargo adapter 1 n=1 Tax=Paramacrobiotus metropolitanus TaxID=2943436 RepID=UPI002445C89C|nr:LOW QUALITY PROTEIN: BICD family-like cargo adapter 1 [Paramacrobiotus metropolitanus]
MSVDAQSGEVEFSTTSQYSLSDLSSGFDLDSYLVELEKRMSQEGDDGSAAGSDLYTQLQQKERDLLLAAELGKALLERNEELTKRQDVLSKDYAARIEELEHERHALKRRLDAIEVEYDGRIAELQNDLTYVQKELQQKEHLFREVDEDRTRLVAELSEQNQRLTVQLKEAQTTESYLSSEVQKLQEQFNARKGSAGDHAKQLELLKEEIKVLSDKKAELERRLQNLLAERDALLHNLEEANEQIGALERRNRDLEYKIVLQDRDLIELRHSNSRLEDQIEELRSVNGSSPSHATSLLNELEAAQSVGSGSEYLGDQLGSKSAGNGSTMDDDDSPASITHEIAHDYKLQQDLMSTYEKLQRVCTELINRQNDESTDETSESATVRPMIEELKGFIQDISRRQNESEFAAKSELKALSRELDIEQEKSRLLQEQLDAQNNKAKTREDEIERLVSELTLRDTELTALRSENALLKQEQAQQEINQDEIVKRAREDRDQAISRQNTLELELTKSKMDIRSLNNQLMEAIAQKIELSQQLEAWQVDMQSILNDQLKEQLHQEEQKRRKYREELAEQKTKAKKFALWR